MSSLRFIIAAAAAVWPVTSAEARDVRRLQPSSKWVVNYADDSCSLGRSFGEGDRKVVLFLEQFVPGDTFRMMLVGKSVDLRSQRNKVSVRFGPNEEESEETGVAATTNNTPAIILHGHQRLAPLTDAEKSAAKAAVDRNMPFEPPSIGAAREKAATWLELGRILRFNLVLETGPMDEPLAALRRCSWDTVRTWGLDVEQQKGLTRKAYPTQSAYTWFSDDDYPGKMLSGGYEAIVNFRILVDETGRTTSCHIQSSTRPKDFDDVVCRIVMRRARFHPALDARGKPAKSYWRQTVTFRMSS
jgi:outer membrane biosynthesis protein TonB